MFTSFATTDLDILLIPEFHKCGGWNEPVFAIVSLSRDSGLCNSICSTLYISVYISVYLLYALMSFVRNSSIDQ